MQYQALIMLVILEHRKRTLNSHSCQQSMSSSFTVRQKIVHLGTTVPRVFILFLLCMTEQDGRRSSTPVEISCTEGGGSNGQGGGVVIAPSQRILAVSTTMPTVHVMPFQPSSMICSGGPTAPIAPFCSKSTSLRLAAPTRVPLAPTAPKWDFPS